MLARVLVGARLAVEMVLEFVPELLHDGDGRHGGGIAQRAERAAQHVLGDVADQVDIGARALPLVEARRIFFSQVVPSRHGMHQPQLS